MPEIVFDRSVIKHKPSDRCAGTHCYTHHVDEGGDREFIACLECGHVFRTGLELWRANLAVIWGFRQFERWRVVARLIVTWAFTRPSRIWTCPHCTHDL